MAVPPLLLQNLFSEMGVSEQPLTFPAFSCLPVTPSALSASGYPLQTHMGFPQRATELVLAAQQLSVLQKAMEILSQFTAPQAVVAPAEKIALSSAMPMASTTQFTALVAPAALAVPAVPAAPVAPTLPSPSAVPVTPAAASAVPAVPGAQVVVPLQGTVLLTEVPTQASACLTLPSGVVPASSSSALEPPGDTSDSWQETKAARQLVHLNHSWTLPACQVTVHPRNPRHFWEDVKLRALEEGD